MAMPLNVLILEDLPADAELMAHELGKAGYEVKWKRVRTEPEFKAALEEAPELILADYSLPGFSVARALSLLQARRLDIPFIVVTAALQDEEAAAECIKLGAADYLLKDRLARLSESVRQALLKKRLHEEQENTERALRETRRLKDSIVSAALDCVITMDREGKIVDFNPAAELTFGFKRAELLGKPMAERLVPPRLREAHARGFARLLATGESHILGKRLELGALRADGTEFPIELIVTATGTWEAPLFTGHVRDITTQVLAQQALRESEERFRSFMEHLPGRASIRDPEGRYTYVNKTWLRAFGMKAETVLGRTPEQIFPVERAAGLSPIHRRTLETKAPQSRIFKTTSDGAEQWWLSHHFPIPDADGNTALVGTVALDITEQKEQEGKIARLNRVYAVLSGINTLIVRVRESSGINSILIRVRNRQELCQQSCRVAVEDGQFPFAWIGILDPTTQDVTPVAWSGERADELTRAKSSARDDTPRGMGAVGRAIRECRAVVNNDISARHFGGPRIEEILKLGFRSQITLPLFENKTVIGTLTMYAREPNFFDEEELKLLTELAGNISFALEHMAQQEKIERLSRIRTVLGEINAVIVRVRSKQDLFAEACRIAEEAGRFPFAWIGIVDRQARQITPIAWAGAEQGFLSVTHSRRSLDEAPPQGHGPAARAVLEKQAVVVNDIQNDPRIQRKKEYLDRNINAAAFLPLLIAGESIGVMALHATEGGYFDEEEMKLVSELAGDIAFALQTIESREKVEYLSYYDALTGLPNRALFIDRTGQQLRGRGGEAPLVALILVNLERFRNINETFGRHGGDDLLKQVAGRLEDAFRGKDYLARIGPDGFGVVVRGLRDAAAVAHTMESQILDCFRRPFVLQAAEVRVAAKAGIAMFPTDGGDADTLFRNAEAALKQARDSGSRYLFYAADMNARAALVLSLENRLRKAVEAQQFVLHYQPKIDLASGALCGLEALIRWQEPGTGMVAPGSFIPVLEETGLILEVGRWVIERALADYRAWTGRGCRTPRIAVNVSAIQLQQGDFADVVIEAVEQGGNIPEALEIEVTESLLMKEVDASIRKLSILRATGIHVAMDDFGTGYSSLSYLARLPINSVKIDRSFISAMGKSAQDMAIVTAIITLARSLNLKVVAEGVETAEQSNLLKLLKCDEAQGYLYSKPLPAVEIEQVLRARE